MFTHLFSRLGEIGEIGGSEALCVLHAVVSSLYILLRRLWKKKLNNVLFFFYRNGA